MKIVAYILIFLGCGSFLTLCIFKAIKSIIKLIKDKDFTEAILGVSLLLSLSGVFILLLNCGA